jgi:hypothetical protein
LAVLGSLFCSSFDSPFRSSREDWLLAVGFDQVSYKFSTV